jgi:hypothetical protein
MNAPCLGLRAGINHFLTLVQVNCFGKRLLASTLSGTHRDAQDDPLGYSVVIHASVLCRSAQQGLRLFLSLLCVVYLELGLMLVFQDMEPHRVSKLMPSPNLSEELPLDYACNARIACILYPKCKIMNAQKPRTVPVKVRQQGDLYKTQVNIFNHRLNSFSSHGRHEEWKAHKVLQTIVQTAAPLIAARGEAVSGRGHSSNSIR